MVDHSFVISGFSCPFLLPPREQKRTRESINFRGKSRGNFRETFRGNVRENVFRGNFLGKFRG